MGKPRKVDDTATRLTVKIGEIHGHKANLKAGWWVQARLAVAICSPV